MAWTIIAETPGVFTQTFSIPEHANDELGHVGNLQYIAWMQDIAIMHSAAQGWPVERYLGNGAVWVVRTFCHLHPTGVCRGDDYDTDLGCGNEAAELRAPGIRSCEHPTGNYWWRPKRSGPTSIAKVVGRNEFQMN